MANLYFSTQVSGSPVSVATGPSQIGYTMFGVECETFSFNIAKTVGAAGFGLNDVLVLAQMPLNSTMVAFYMSTAQIDSNGTPLLTVAFGDTSSTARYATGSTFGRTALDVWSNAINGYVAGSLPFAYTAQTSSPPTGIVLATSQNVADYFQMKITAAPATATTSGTIKGFVLYTLNTAS